MALKRIRSEIKEIYNERNEYYYAKPAENDMFKWYGVIKGPKQTPFEGGIFNLLIILPQNYPFKPPIVTFLTKIFHPNIGYKGSICLDILKKEWSPVLTISKILLSIVSLLNEPNPNDPLFHDAAHLFMYDIENYNEIAKRWTEIYAKII